MRALGHDGLAQLLLALPQLRAGVAQGRLQGVDRLGEALQLGAPLAAVLGPVSSTCHAVLIAPPLLEDRAEVAPQPQQRGAVQPADDGRGVAVAVEWKCSSSFASLAEVARRRGRRGGRSAVLRRARKFVLRGSPPRKVAYMYRFQGARRALAGAPGAAHPLGGRRATAGPR